MEPTFRAIMARNNQDPLEAYRYCMNTLHGCKNEGLAKEYFTLAMMIKNRYPKQFSEMV